MTAGLRKFAHKEYTINKVSQPRQGRVRADGPLTSFRRCILRLRNESISRYDGQCHSYSTTKNHYTFKLLFVRI